MARDADHPETTHQTDTTGDFLADAYVLQDALEHATAKLEHTLHAKDIARLATLCHKYEELCQHHHFPMLMQTHSLMYKLYQHEAKHLPPTPQQRLYKQQLLLFMAHIATIQRQTLKRIAKGEQEGDIKADILRLDSSNYFIEQFLRLAGKYNMLSGHSRLDKFLHHFLQNEQETLSYFLPEAKTLLHNLNEALEHFDSQNHEHGLNRFFRTLHTLKGSAYMVSLTPVGDISHLLEDVLSLSREGDATPESIRPVLQQGIAALEDMVHYLEGTRESSTSNFKPLLEQLNLTLYDKHSSQNILIKLYPLAETSPEGEDIQNIIQKQQIVPNQAQPDSDSLEADGWIGLAEHQASAEIEQNQLASAAKAEDTLSQDPSKPEGTDEHLTKGPSPKGGLSPKGYVEVPTNVQVGEGQAETPTLATPVQRKKFSKAHNKPPQGILHTTTPAEDMVMHDTLRVNTQDLDSLMRLTGEMILSRYQYQQRFQEMHQLEQRLQQAEHYIQRLRKQPADKVHAGLGNLYKHLQSSRQRSQFLYQALRDDNDFLNDLGYKIRERLSHTRMVPLSQLFSQLRRLVEQIEQEQADYILEQRKNYRLEVSGASLEIDSSLADALLSPLRHLISNALVHGIESLPERAERGKLPQGVIRLEATRQDKHIRIDVIDDGRGLSAEKIGATALERGLKTVEEIASMPEQDILNMVLLPGFSTADSLSKHAGRGVGLDAVNTQVQKLKGHLSMHSQLGKGTRISLEIPPTLLSSQVLSFEVGAKTFSIPAENVISLRRIPASLRSHKHVHEQISLDNRRIDFYDLAQILDIPIAPSTDAAAERYPVIMVQNDKGPLLLGVSKFGKVEPAISYPLPPSLQSMQHVAGVSLLEDGRLVPLLHSDGVIKLRQQNLGRYRKRAPGKPMLSKSSTTQLSHARGRILVAEDSTTVRELLAQWLRRAGFRVTAVANGQKAFDTLMQHTFDLLITDIEMPHMDGYELIEAVMNQAQLRHLPIIVMTSRVRDEHRNLAMDLGARAYLTKPVKSQLLMKQIQRLLS